MAENLTGQTFGGRYRLLEVLGAGGMGVVYRARDERLERDVAIKVLAPGVLDDERVRKRFRKEALALSRLNHPNVAAVYDFLTETGHDLIVMELVPGPTLDQRLAKGALPPKEVLALGKQLAEALAAAHQEGVIHRDLKPANLRFTGDQRLKVLDFGLAEVQTGPNTQLTTASFRSDSSVSGTLPYMAPEQLRGDPPDVRSDVYAAGAVLYEMATGQRAFPQAGFVIVDAILNQPPQPPAQLNPQVSPGLENAIMKALDKNPGYRYQTARDLLAELERLTSSTTTVTGMRPLPPSPRRGRTKVFVGTAITLLVLIGIAWAMLRNFGRPSDSPDARPVSVLQQPAEATPTPSPQPKTASKPAADASHEAPKKTATAPAPPAAPATGAGLATVPAVPAMPNANVPAINKEALKAAIQQQQQMQQEGEVRSGRDLAAAEGDALGFMGNIIGGAAQYKVKLGYYPDSLPTLTQFLRDQRKAAGKPERTGTECPPVDPCMRGGYSFYYRRPSPQSGYVLEARPIAYPYTGKRSFFANETGGIRATSEDRAATLKDPPIQ